jgi:SpoVK/Ycf46/Vps4 family AAA+-type ATPase
VATEGGATFLSIDASSIENKWLGESEKNAKAVFTLARRLAPCVVFIDEVDSVLSSREHGDDSSHGTLTSVKTTLMQEWDGLRTTKDRVVVIASTNRPFDLDEAVLRRLPRRIMVDLPDQQTRTDILRVTLSNNRLAPEVNLTKIGELLNGYTGSDIKEVCREAVVKVAHESAQALENSATASYISGNYSEFAGPGSHKTRPVSMNDFHEAISKLKASVDNSGKEIQKVLDWNEKYGEIKKSKKRSSSYMSMYI